MLECSKIPRITCRNPFQGVYWASGIWKKLHIYLKLPKAQCKPLQYSLILYHTILYYILLYYSIFCYTIVYFTILYYTILYYTILYYILLYYSIFYYTIVYFTILDYTRLYYTNSVTPSQPLTRRPRAVERLRPPPRPWRASLVPWRAAAAVVGAPGPSCACGYIFI